MRIGVLAHVGTDLDGFIRRSRALADRSFDIWAAQIFGYDTLSAIAIASQEVDVAFGTAVVPTYPRHPMALAAQAATVHLASGGRLTLGVGPSHKPVVQQMWGFGYEDPVGHVDAYVRALRGLLAGERVDVEGPEVTVHGQLDFKVDPPLPVVISALGPKMLEVAGRIADGTVTWMTGVRTLGDHVVPTIRAAASRHERPAPRIVAVLPICVTGDSRAAREAADVAFAVYPRLAAYRRMLDRENASGVGDISLVGDERKVTELIEQVAAAGVTELVAEVYHEPVRTLALLEQVAGAAAT